MVEAEISPLTPTGVLIPFAMLTALLIFVHIASLLIATRMLPELEAIIKHPMNYPSSISKSFTWPVRIVWYLSNVVGTILFLVHLVFVAFVKFYPTTSDGTSTCTPGDPNRIHVGTATLAVVVLLSLVSLPFIIIFFRSISKKKIQLHEENLEKARVLLENMNIPRPAGMSVDSDSFTASGSYERQQSANRSIDTQV